MKYKIHKKNGRDIVIRDTDNNGWIPFDEKNSSYKKYLEWVAEGNTAEVEDMTPAPVDPQIEIDKAIRKTAAKLLKDKVKNKDALSKSELATILGALMDLIS